MVIRNLLSYVLSPLVLGLPLATLSAQAQVPQTVELKDGNSKVVVGLDDFSVDGWSVDGVNQTFQLFGEMYFLNLGQAQNSPEVRLNTFQLNKIEQSSDRALTAYLTGFGGILGFQYDLELNGGALGSGFSQRIETVTLTNRSNSTQGVSLFSYMDFEVAGTFKDDSASIQGSTLTLTDPTGAKITVKANQQPSFVQVDRYPALLVELYNGSRTTLNGKSSLNNEDATAALQFVRTLAPGESTVFKFLKEFRANASIQPVPEPSDIIALSTLGGAVLAIKRSKKVDEESD